MITTVEFYYLKQTLSLPMYQGEIISDHAQLREVRVFFCIVNWMGRTEVVEQ